MKFIDTYTYTYIYIYIIYTRIERTPDIHQDMGPRGTTGSLAPGAAYPERGGPPAEGAQRAPMSRWMSTVCGPHVRI